MYSVPPKLLYISTLAEFGSNLGSLEIVATLVRDFLKEGFLFSGTDLTGDFLLHTSAPDAILGSLMLLRRLPLLLLLVLVLVAPLQTSEG